MNKRFYIFIIFCFAVLLTSLFSCKKDSNNPEPETEDPGFEEYAGTEVYISSF